MLNQEEQREDEVQDPPEMTGPRTFVSAWARGQQETASGRVQAWLWFLGLWGKDRGGLQAVGT